MNYLPQNFELWLVYQYVNEDTGIVGHPMLGRVIGWTINEQALLPIVLPYMDGDFQATALDLDHRFHYTVTKSQQIANDTLTKWQSVYEDTQGVL